ncbi:nitroreductase [Paracoccus sp. S-4012]|uniref:nitroreductase n=1 Tax=Paracoccus sp. S-4012 TaxID=2665648 RepID=UPI001E3D337A|nr:nitroreductase [Paracoccus sp. S-4012]
MSERLDTVASLANARHSCRAFLPDPVPEPVIRELIAIAGRAPSWCNCQPWTLHLLSLQQTNELRPLLREAAATPAPDIPFPAEYTGVYRERRRETARQLYDAVGVEWGNRQESARQSLRNFDLFDAPQLLILSTPKSLLPYSLVDCGIFLGGFLLAAEAVGVATIPQAALATCAPLLHRHLDIAEDLSIVCGVSLGYARPDAPENAFRTDRAELKDFLHRP